MVLQRLINSSDSIIPHTWESNCRSLYLAFSLRDAMPNGTIINRYDCVGNPFWASRYLTLKHDQQSKPNIQKHIHVGKVLNWKKRKTTFSTATKFFVFFKSHVYVLCRFKSSVKFPSNPYFTSIFLTTRLLIEFDVLKHKAEMGNKKNSETQNRFQVTLRAKEKIKRT